MYDSNNSAGGSFRQIMHEIEPEAWVVLVCVDMHTTVSSLCFLNHLALVSAIALASTHSVQADPPWRGH